MSPRKAWPSRLERAEEAVAVLSRAVAGVFIVALMLLVAAASIGRWSGVLRVPGAVELSGYLLVGLVYLGMAGAMAEGRVIRVELLYGRLGPRGRRWADATSFILAAVVTLLLSWFSWELVAEAWGRSIRSIGELRLPLAPIYFLIVAGLVLLLVQIVLRLAALVLGAPPTAPTTPHEAIEDATL